MRQHRWLATGVGLALLLTTAASTTYADGYGQPDNKGYQHDPDVPWLCQHVPPAMRGWFGCGKDVDHDDGVPSTGTPSTAATPELDSLLLFGFGVTGLGGYAVTRYRARRRG